MALELWVYVQNFKAIDQPVYFPRTIQISITWGLFKLHAVNLSNISPRFYEAAQEMNAKKVVTGQSNSLITISLHAACEDSIRPTHKIKAMHCNWLDLLVTSHVIKQRI